MDVATVAALGQALSDQTRVRLLGIMDGRTTVGEAAVALNITSATVSHHVAVLERAGLVEVIRRGRRSVLRRVPNAGRVLARALG